jgi:hypothetical protein
VIDVLRGAEFPAKVNGRTYPANNKKDVPREIAVKLLGPEIQAALSERGIKASSIGYPLTYHSWRAGGVPADAVAKVTCGGKPLDGLVIVHGRNRITAAPGMMTFYPLAPLKPGLPIRAAFTSGDGSKALASWGFQCK